jgi:hypothetical protein
MDPQMVAKIFHYLSKDFDLTRKMRVFWQKVTPKFA